MKVAKSITAQKYRRPFYILLIGILTIFGLIMRLEYLEQTIIEIPIRSDARQYVIYGYNLVHHQIFSSQFTKNTPEPDSFRSPGYPLLMALAFLIGGTEDFYPLIRNWQALLGTLMIPLTFFLALGPLSSRWALIAAALVCFSPHLISMTSYLLTETLFGTVLLVALLLLRISLVRRNGFYLAIAAICFGIAYFVNETIVLIPFGLALLIWILTKDLQGDTISRVSSRHLIVFIIIFACFPIGWSARNHVSLSEDAMRGSRRALKTLSHGAYPGFIHENPDYKYYPYREDPRQPEFSASIKDFSSILWERFKKRPLRYLRWYIFEKPYYLWSWTLLQGENEIYIYPVETSLYFNSRAADITRIFMKTIHPYIVIASLIGFIILLSNIRLFVSIPADLTTALLFYILVYYTLFYMVFAPWPRYSIPLRPVLYICSLWSVKMLLTVSKRIRTTKNAETR